MSTNSNRAPQSPLTLEDGLTIWLVGGEDDDVDAFLDAIEHPDD